MRIAGPLPFNSSRKQRHGYTFAELVAVLLIIGVLSSVAVPRYGAGIDGFRAEAAARRIAADLNRARRNAKLTGTTREVEFTIDPNRYDMPGLTDPDKPSAALYRVDLDETPYPAELISVVFERVGGSDDKIKFDMYGHTTTENLPITGGTIVVESGTVQRTVVVDPVTGEARLDEQGSGSGEEEVEL